MLSDDGAEGRGEGSTETRTGEGADGAGPSSGNGGVNEGRTVREVFDTLLSDLGGSLWAEDSGDAEAADPGRPGETPSEASHAGAHFNVHDVVGRERLLGQLSKRISSVLRVVTTGEGFAWGCAPSAEPSSHPGCECGKRHCQAAAVRECPGRVSMLVASIGTVVLCECPGRGSAQGNVLSCFRHTQPAPRSVRRRRGPYSPTSGEL